MTDTSLERLKNRIDTRLNNCLCEMKPGWDDSVCGFNEAWDIVRAIFKEEMEIANVSGFDICNCGASTHGKWAGIHQAGCAAVTPRERHKREGA